MDTLQRWLEGSPTGLMVLDLGCGRGSFDYAERCSPGTIVIGVDTELSVLSSRSQLASVCADGASLPFRTASFDLIICHHSLEHFRDVAPVIREIARTLKPRGRLFVSVPDGYSFSDRLYRTLLTGGGHFQQFSFRDLVKLVEGETGLRLAVWERLYSSFNFVDPRTFQPAPKGPLPGPFPRRMRYIGKLPSGLISGTRVLLNIVTRCVDRLLGSSLSLYGWAFAFDSVSEGRAIEEAASPNVCMRCGLGAQASELSMRRGRWLYTCRACGGVNLAFRG